MMLKDKKKLLIILAIVATVILCTVLAFIFLKDNETPNTGTKPNDPVEEVVIPDAPSENTEALIQNHEKMEVTSLTNDVIEFSENLAVEIGEKVAVWVYSTPKFLGYFEVVIENNVKMIKGLEAAMKNLQIEAGEHNLAIVTEEGESIGYIDVYIDENKLFEDEKSAEIAKYTTKEVTEEIEIKFQTETKKDANKNSSYKQVTQKGVNGIKEVTYKITYDENGDEISKEQVSEKVIKNAVNEIIVVGSADYNVNSSKITSEFTGWACTESQTTLYEGEKACNDMELLPSFKAISIDSINYYIVSIDEVSITPIKVTKNGNLYKGTYKGTTYYFDARSGGGENIPLTLEICKQYNLSCGAW